jgi:hypothetical protein
MSVFAAYIFKPFLIFSVLCFTGVIAWFLRRHMKPSKLKEFLLSRI